MDRSRRSLAGAPPAADAGLPFPDLAEFLRRLQRAERATGDAPGTRRRRRRRAGRLPAVDARRAGHHLRDVHGPVRVESLPKRRYLRSHSKPDAFFLSIGLV